MILALLALAVQAPPSPTRVLIRDVTVVSPERRTPLRHGYVVLGKVANLLLLRADPLETVTAYDAIDLVISRGQIIERARLTAS